MGSSLPRGPPRQCRGPSKTCFFPRGACCRGGSVGRLWPARARGRPALASDCCRAIKREAKRLPIGRGDLRFPTCPAASIVWSSRARIHPAGNTVASGRPRLLRHTPWPNRTYWCAARFPSDVAFYQWSIGRKRPRRRQSSAEPLPRQSSTTTPSWTISRQAVHDRVSRFSIRYSVWESRPAASFGCGKLVLTCGGGYWY